MFRKVESNLDFIDLKSGINSINNNQISSEQNIFLNKYEEKLETTTKTTTQTTIQNKRFKSAF